MIMSIVTYGQEVLKQPARPIEAITPEITELAQSMLETMRECKGVGLAAQQVGRTENICVIDVPPEMEDEDCADLNRSVTMPLVMINPEIMETEGALRRNEGCLSFPELYIPITRPRSVRFSYTNLQGRRMTATVYGLLARAVLHETDHLRGVLLSDRMSPLQRKINAGKLRRIRAMTV